MPRSAGRRIERSPPPVRVRHHRGVVESAARAPLKVPGADLGRRSAPPPGAYRWFAAGVGSWFAAWGMQQVLFAWLVVGELHAGPRWVGIAQTASMLPSLLLLLLGGAAAERSDTRALLVRLHALAALPVLGLAAGLARGWLSLPGLVLYGLAIGTVQAFVMPARDTLLSRVAGDDMMRAVTGMTAVQFGAQAAGSLLAGAARALGTTSMLAVQAAILLLGSAATTQVPPAPPLARGAVRHSILREITAGLPVVARTPELLWPLMLVASVGLFFIGPFLVVFPLLVRDVYGGDAFDLSLVLMLFPAGTIAGSLFIRSRGGIRRKGRAALAALAFGACNLALIGGGPPFWGLLLATLAWGLGGSVFINCSRTLFQEAAPPAERARALSVYQLGFMGAAPIGTSWVGVASACLGLHGTLLTAAAAMLAVVAALTLFTQTPRME
jgi:predicted MFS family arabinose efflux permease